jgi:hypothetical protein
MSDGCPQAFSIECLAVPNDQAIASSPALHGFCSIIRFAGGRTRHVADAQVRRSRRRIRSSGKAKSRSLQRASMRRQSSPSTIPPGTSYDVPGGRRKADLEGPRRSRRLMQDREGMAGRGRPSGAHLAAMRMLTIRPGGILNNRLENNANLKFQVISNDLSPAREKSKQSQSPAGGHARASPRIPAHPGASAAPPAHASRGTTIAR